MQFMKNSQLNIVWNLKKLRKARLYKIWLQLLKKKIEFINLKYVFLVNF